MGQLINNKNKELEQINKYTHNHHNHTDHNHHLYQQKLAKVALDKISNSIGLYRKRLLEKGLIRMREFAEKEEEREIYFVRKFRIFKLFRAWKD